MDDNKQTRAYFRGKLYSGKRPLARAMDAVLLCLFSLFGSYMWFLFQVKNSLLSGILAAVTACFFAVALKFYREIKLERFTKKELERLRTGALLASLTLMETGELIAMVARQNKLERTSHCMGVIVSGDSLYTVIRQHPDDPVTPTQLVDAYEKAKRCACGQLHVYSLAPYSKHAAAFAATLPINTVLHQRDELLAYASAEGVLPSDEAIYDQLNSDISRAGAARKRFSGALLPSNSRRYLMCAALIAGASFITGYRIYYPVMAAVCVALAGYSYYMGKRRASEAEA